MPRTLIFGAKFSTHYGTGTYLAMLFKGWPREKLATICGDPYPIDWSACDRHYETGSLEYGWKWPFCYGGPKKFSGSLQPSSAFNGCSAAQKASNPELRSFRAKLKSKLRSKILGVCQVDLLKRETLSEQLVSWVREFDPEVIYARPSYIVNNRLLKKLQVVCGKPLVLHYMDDWPENLYSNGLLDGMFRSTYLKEFVELVKSADANVAICKEMADEYEGRYGRKFHWLENPVDIGPFRDFTRTEWSAGKPFRIRYGGRIGWAISQSLLDMAAVVHELRKSGVNVVFEIHSSQAAAIAQECRQYDGVSIHALGPYKDLPKSLFHSDLLFICYDFDPGSIKLARLSMPGKMGECLATGTPVLVYGPKGSPVIEYARRAQWGSVVDERSHEKLTTTLKELIANAALRERLGTRSIQLANEVHTSDKVSENLGAILRGVIRRGTSKNS